MNIATRRFSTEELFQAMMASFSYQTIGIGGILYWQQSQDLTGATLASILREHEFVECIAKSATLAYAIEKDLTGATLTRTFPIAEIFFDAQGSEGGNTPPKHDVSEHFKAYREVASRLNIEDIRFVCDPLSVISPNGLLEGEMINTFITRLREATNRKEFKNAVDGRKRQIRQKVLATSRYIKRLVENTPYLFAYRLDLSLSATAAADIPPGELSGLIDKFLLALEADLAPGSLAGHLMKREYLTEIGYRYHVFLLIDWQKTQCGPALVSTFYTCWNAVTNGAASFFNHAYQPDNPRSYGAGSVRDIFPDGTLILLRAIRLMLTADLYIHLDDDPLVENFVIGKLPRPLDKSVRTTFSAQSLPFDQASWHPSGI